LAVIVVSSPSKLGLDFSHEMAAASYTSAEAQKKTVELGFCKWKNLTDVWGYVWLVERS